MNRAVVAAIPIALAVLAVTGCGSDGKKANPQPSGFSPKSGVEHPCENATLTVPAGRELDFTSCGPNAAATVTDPNKVLNQLGTLVFIARAPGQATIDVTRAPTCTPGQMCSQARELVARIVVNVT